MIQAPVKHKRVIKGLGFTRLNQIVVREDTPSIRGMVRTVPHLVRIIAKERLAKNRSARERLAGKRLVISNGITTSSESGGAIPDRR